jgi:hypothetical protein
MRPDDEDDEDYGPGEEPEPSICSMIDDPIDETGRDPE